MRSPVYALSVALVILGTALAEPPGLSPEDGARQSSSQNANAPKLLTGSLARALGTAPGLRFVPSTPCRIADTRNAAGPFGGPKMAGGTTRSFTPSMSG